MGNDNLKKIVILVDKSDEDSFSYGSIFKEVSDIKPVIYYDWGQFTQKQVIEEVKDIIVKYKDKSKKEDKDNDKDKSKSRDKNREENGSSPPKPKIATNQQMRRKVEKFTANQCDKQKSLKAICPLFDPSSEGTMKDKLINHVKKYSVKINIYLLVDKVDNVEQLDNFKLMHYQKPYIKLIHSNLEYIARWILKQKDQKEEQTKSIRMFEGMYRRMVVKVLDQFYVEKETEKEKQDKGKKKQDSTIQEHSKLVSAVIKQKIIPEVRQRQQKRLKQDVKLFQKYKIQPQYFNNMELFQKSFISTTCEYVICGEENLMNVIDSKIKCDQEFKIIVRERMPDNRQLMNKGNESRENKWNKSQSLNVWISHYDLENILMKISACTEITEEQAPFLSRNIVIIGDDHIYKQYVLKQGKKQKMINTIKAFLEQRKVELQKKQNKKSKSDDSDQSIKEKAIKIQQQFEKLNRKELENSNNTFEFNKQIIYSAVYNQIKRKYDNSFKSKSKQDAQKQQDFQVTLMGQEYQQSLIPQLEKSMYSYVVVFTQNQVLQKVKKLLREKGFHERVQLTSIPQPQKEKNITTEQKLFEYKQLYLVSKKVPYLIKFQIGPIVSIHLYRPSDQLFRYFNDKIGLKASRIENMEVFKKDYAGPSYKRIVESKRLVCNHRSYIQQIFPQIQCIQRLGLKIIIFDQDRKKIRQLANDPKYFRPEVEYMDCQKLRLQDFILRCKSPSVSLSYFRPSVLTEFMKQSREVDKYSSNYSLDLQSSVFSSNQTIKQILGNNYLGLNTQYSTGLTVFSHKDLECENEISRFETKYLRSFVKLWYFSYGIIKKNTPETKSISPEKIPQKQAQKKQPQKKTQKKSQKQQQKQPQNQLQKHKKQKAPQSQIQLLKQQISYLFYKCKSYDLLKANEDDFKEFYIQRIADCQDMFDLQIACIYILSLPHGFNNVISDLFRSPRISKIAIKIFVVYIVVLMSVFYDFRNEEQETIQIMTYLNDQNKLNKQIKNLKKGDTVFTNNFVFCIDSKRDSTNSEKANSHILKFKFDSIRVLNKSRIKSYINIEKYSFYKQGPEFVISPFTKFVVNSVKIHSQRVYEIQLQDITDRLQSFPFQILNENNLQETLLFNTFHAMKKDQTNKNNFFPYADKNSMYKITQTANILRNKEELVQEFRKSTNYNLFFQAKLQIKYMTANFYLVKEMKCQLEKVTNTGEVNEQKLSLKNLGVETAYLHYHFHQYALSIEVLKKIKEIIEDEWQRNNKKHQWKKQKIEIMTTSVKETFENRRKEILNYPKKKYWKVSLNLGKVEKSEKIPKFTLKSRSEQWQSKYDDRSEIFSLTYLSFRYQNEQDSSEITGSLTPLQKLQKKHDGSLIKKDLKFQTLIPKNPPNEFGQSGGKDKSSSLFAYLNYYPEIQQSAPQVKTQQKSKDEDITDPFKRLFTTQSKQGQGRVEKWQVFYLNMEPKVVNLNKKHYHIRLNPCSHNHKYRQVNAIQKMSKNQDKFKVQNNVEETGLYEVPNEIGEDEFYVQNINWEVQDTS